MAPGPRFGWLTAMYRTGIIGAKGDLCREGCYRPDFAVRVYWHRRSAETC